MSKSEGGGSQSFLVLIAIAGALFAPHVSGSTAPSDADGAPRRNGEERAVDIELGDGVVRVKAKAPPPSPAEQTKELLAGLVEAGSVQLPDFQLSDALGPVVRGSAGYGVQSGAAAAARGVLPLLVSVPDPRQSQMALYYDQMLVVLRQALAAEGYVQDHFALPWQKDTEPKKRSARKAGSWSPDSAVPGFILFRHPSGRHLLAILTTESPVIGALVPQLDLALEVAAALSYETVPIVGPFFSGSKDSFVKVLKEFKSQTFHLVTGSATGAIDEELRRVSVFERTVPTDAALFSLITRTLQHFDSSHSVSSPTSDGRRHPRKIAKLIEVGTGYGRDAIDQTSDTLKVDPFSFPIHISDVRAERERVLAIHPTPLMGLRRTLGLRFDTSREREPDVPATLSYLTAFVDDLTLGQQLLGICDQRYRFLIIQATDPIDIVYLAQEARKYCPDLTPVILGYNELFTHPDLGSTLSGALVAAPYAPSFRLAMTPEGRPRHAFSSAVSQGFYNAVLKALGAKRERFLGFECDDWGNCKCDMYLSQLAGAQPWPLVRESWPAPVPGRQPSSNIPASQSIEPRRVSSAATSDAAAPPIEANSTSQARLLAWPVLLVAIFHLFARRFRRGMLTSDNAAWKAAQAFRVVVADMSLAVLVLLSCLPFMVITWDLGFEQIFERPTVQFISLVGAAALAWLLAESVSSARSIRFDSGWSRKTKIASAAAVLGTGLLLAAVVQWLASLELAPADGASPLAFVVLRLLDPFRMSPAMPLLYVAAGVYAWALFALRRIGRLARFPAKPPCNDEVVAASPVSSAINALWKELCEPWSQARYGLAILLLLCFVVWRFLDRVRPSFEGAAYDSAFRFGCVLLGLFVAGEAVRFLTLSSLLLDLLRELASQPMVDAYNRISRRVSGSFGLQLDARVPSPHELKISAFTCRSLANLARAPVPFDNLDLAGAAAKVEEKMRALGTTPYAASAEEAAHAALFDAAGRVHEGLEAVWKSRARAPDIEQTARDLDVAELLPGGHHENSPTPLLLMAAMPRERYIWARMAEDFVALRISTFIYQVLHELRHTLTFVLLGALLLVASVTSYPFQPAHILRLCVWSVVVLVVIMALTRMLALERNEILSRLGGTRPDRIEWNAAFIQQLAIYVVLPLAAAVIGLFPGLGDALATQLSALARIIPPSS